MFDNVNFVPSPAGLETQIGEFAGSLGVQVVECQDFWRGHVRHGGRVRPDLVLTLDDFAKVLVIEDLGLTAGRVVIAGNSGVKKVVVSSEFRDYHERFSTAYNNVFFYAGAGSATSEELNFLALCILETKGRSLLVVGFHPKQVEKYGDEWQDKLEKIRETGIQVIEAELGMADFWSSLTTTIAGYSTTLTTAAYHGMPAVSLHTPATIASLAKHQLGQVLQVGLGCAHDVHNPLDLSALGFLAEGAKKLKPYDSEVAWAAVKVLL